MRYGKASARDMTSKASVVPGPLSARILLMRSKQAISRQNLQSIFASAPNTQGVNPNQRTQRDFPSQFQSDPRQGQQQYEGDFSESPQATQSPDEQSLSQMADLDKYGLRGLLAMIRHEGSDIGALAVGQDLTALGLDLNQHEPLYQSFASPFSLPGARPVEPDFQVPECYQVSNVMPIQQKVSSFSEDTLFFMFYNTPRDISQEIAANELTNRGWRYHKTHQRWLTKEATTEPVRLSTAEERGVYVYFDPLTWNKNRKEIVLRYDELDHRPASFGGL
ncbi:MAG: hypothetical protein M1814_004336 [Vezdaea aestivalis]|nr:MAG: hypothetical protein M1814_004336 [Vezdaea aestivalis]